MDISRLQIINPEEKAAAMMRSPLGRAVATIAAGSGISARELAVPETSVWLCVEASDDIEVWNSVRDEILAFLERGAPKHEGFLRKILAQPSVSWWFEPMDRDGQVWVSRDESPPSENSLVTPSEPPTRWERYALKPAGGLFHLHAGRGHFANGGCDRLRGGRLSTVVWETSVHDMAHEGSRVGACVRGA